MKFCIITHVLHTNVNDKFAAYGPYVREMNIWLKYVDEVIIVAPLSTEKISPIDVEYNHNKIKFIKIKSFNFLNSVSIFKSLYYFPVIIFQIFNAMRHTDHIHLRCPGNVGLLGCIIQVFFPKKKKTAKYAGNWDSKSKQPISYRLQKWILSNTFLTKNMQVLVYGEWENSAKNIKPFFTASYFENEKKEVIIKSLDKVIKFVFVGTLSNGKQPLYAVQLIEQLLLKNRNVELIIFGEGHERDLIKNYIIKNKIEDRIQLKGNQNQETIKKAYLENHFVVLPSLSEGWPKAVAEGMFWGCLPIATKVSCVPNMLDKGNRGILLELNLQMDVQKIESILDNENMYINKVTEAINWSRHYTLELFEEEIKKLL